MDGCQVMQEYQILSGHSLHPNIPVLYGAFRCCFEVMMLLMMATMTMTMLLLMATMTITLLMITTMLLRFGLITKNRCGPHIWLSMELCAFGSVADLSAGLVERGRWLESDFGFYDNDDDFRIMMMIFALLLLMRMIVLDFNFKPSFNLRKMNQDQIANIINFV